MKFTKEQLEEIDKIIKLYKSKDKELKKLGKILFINFLSDNKIENIYVKYRFIYVNYKGIVTYDQWQIKQLKDLTPNICMYLLTCDNKYLSKGWKIYNNFLRINNLVEYSLNEFYNKINV